MIILIDFDGTCVKHRFPDVGEEIGAVPVLKELVEKGHKLILYTMRCNHTIDMEMPTSTDGDIYIKKGLYLDDAVNWFQRHDIPLFGVQENPEQRTWTSSPKPYGHMIIDDTALGVPLTHEYDPNIDDFIKYVNWSEVRKLLTDYGII